MLQPGEALQDRLEGDLRLQARKRCPETEVDSVGEREMTVALASDVEDVGIGELDRVAIRR